MLGSYDKKISLNEDGQGGSVSYDFYRKVIYFNEGELLIAEPVEPGPETRPRLRDKIRAFFP